MRSVLAAAVLSATINKSCSSRAFSPPIAKSCREPRSALAHRAAIVRA